MNKAPLLSVAVPTYNRPDKFRRMLTGLLPQLTSETELVIRDDSPNEETKKVLDGLIKKFNPPCKLSYFHGEKIGLDAANLFLVEHSTGEYLWWFSDDDELLPGAVARVLELVKKHPDISFVWVNFGVQKFGNPAINRADGFFKDGNEVLDVLGTGIGLLSSLIFRCADGIAAMPLAKKHIVGFSFASLVLIFHVISGNKGLYFLSGPYILCHPTTPEEFKKSFIKNEKIENIAFNSYGVDFYNILMEFKGKFSRSAVRRILSVNFASLWRGMAVAWIGGWDTPKGKRWKMFKLYWSFPEFWIAMPLFLLPLWVNKILYKGYKLFFSHRRFKFLE